MSFVLLLSLIQVATPVPAPAGLAPPAAPSVVVPPASATDGTNYAVSRPHVRVRGDALRVDGTVCRKPNRTGLTPSQVRIERIDATGSVAESVSAFLPPLSRRQDQRCGHYGANLKAASEGDTIRVCIARRTCPSS